MSDTPLPTTLAEAQSEIEQTRADTSHPYHRGDTQAVDRMLALHRVVYAPPPTDVPSPPPASEERESRRQARIAEIQANPQYQSGDWKLSDELATLLLGGDVLQPETEAPERAPVAFAEAQLPHLSLPADTDPEEARALREIVAHAGMDARTVQTAVDTVVRLAQQPLPEDPAEWPEIAEREGDRAIRETRQRYGHRWQDVLGQVAQGKAIVLREAPQLYALIHAHPHMVNSMELFETLATLGAKSREFHVSKYGTSWAVRV